MDRFVDGLAGETVGVFIGIAAVYLMFIGWLITFLINLPRSPRFVSLGGPIGNVGESPQERRGRAVDRAFRQHLAEDWGGTSWINPR